MKIEKCQAPKMLLCAAKGRGLFLKPHQGEVVSQFKAIKKIQNKEQNCFDDQSLLIKSTYKDRLGTLHAVITPDNQLVVKIPFDCQRNRLGSIDNPTDKTLEKRLTQKVQPEVKKSMKLIDRIGRDNGYGVIRETKSTLNASKIRKIRQRCASIDKEYSQLIDLSIHKIPVIASIDNYLWENDQLIENQYLSTRQPDYEQVKVNYNNDLMRFITLTIPSNTENGIIDATAFSSYIDSRLNDYLRNLADRIIPVKFDDGINQCEMPYYEYLRLIRKYKKGGDATFNNGKLEYNLINSKYFITGHQIIAVQKVKEFQKRGMLHWHLIVGAENSNFLENIDKTIKPQWVRILKGISKYKENGLFDRLMENGETIKDYWLRPENLDKIRVQSEIPRHNCATYMSKYLSKKEDKQGYGCKESMVINGVNIAPVRWSSNNRKVLKLSKKHSINYLSPKKIPIKEIEKIVKKCTKILIKAGVIKHNPIRVVRAKKDSLGIKKGDKYIYSDKKNGEGIDYPLSQKYNIPFNNLYQSNFLIDENSPNYKEFLKKYDIKNITDLYEYEFYKYCYGVSDRKPIVAERVNTWLEQLGYSDISQWVKSISKNASISNGYAHIKELIRNMIDSCKGENFTPDDIVDYINNCLKTTSISLYQLAGYFKD